MKKLVAILALLALICGSAHGGAVLTFQNDVDGYGGGNDTWIEDANKDTSHGTYWCGYISNDIEKSLYRFDLSSMVGAYTDINSISLTLHFPWNDISVAGTISVYTISQANAAWGETQATWNNLYTGGPAWAGSAGLSTATTDYDPTALATWSFDPATTPNGDTVFTLGSGSLGSVKDLVDLWSVPATNAGLVLVMTSPEGENWPAHTGYVGNGIDIYSPLLTVDLVANPGDVNADGKVDIFDATVILGNWGKPSPTWNDGDVSGSTPGVPDNVIDALDLDQVENCWGFGYPSEPPEAPVPEPTTLLILAGGVLAALVRRR